MSQVNSQMALVAFLQAQNCSNYVYSWRHPDTMSDFMTPEYYQRIGRTLEDGKFDLAFFDDRLAMPDKYGDDYVEAVANGIRTVKMDLVPVMSMMAATTSRLGIGGTYSTTYFEPFHVARVFATLDLMTRGRAAWNVVTSLNDSEAANMGRDESLPHDMRYDRADEFMQVVHGHWDTWEDDAIIGDKNGCFADPSKVHPLEHRGDWFASRGPFTVPRSPQGYPVVIQAGQSGRGRAFAARWSELVFALHPDLQLAKKFYQLFKTQAQLLGRESTLIKICPLVVTIVGDTRTAAEEKLALIEKLPKPIDGVVLLSEVLNFDFASKGLDEPFTDEELANISGLQAIRDQVVALSGKKNPSVRDFVEVSNRGNVREHPLFCGSPKDVADGLEEWFTDEGCDGFVIAATHIPGAYEDFVRLVVPVLQKRGLFRKEYTGSTLREHLGLPKPPIGAWKLPAKA
jgi:FMN-dependent oxidoreductase (nitrilotriacetate monooxygenase family)